MTIPQRLWIKEYAETHYGDWRAYEFAKRKIWAWAKDETEYQAAVREYCRSAGLCGEDHKGVNLLAIHANYHGTEWNEDGWA